MPKYANPLKPEKKPDKPPTYNMRRSELEAMAKQATHDGMAAGIYVCNAITGTYEVYIIEEAQE